jgi:hypothetical protein
MEREQSVQRSEKPCFCREKRHVFGEAPLTFVEILPPHGRPQTRGVSTPPPLSLRNSYASSVTPKKNFRPVMA